MKLYFHLKINRATCFRVAPSFCQTSLYPATYRCRFGMFAGRVFSVVCNNAHFTHDLVQIHTKLLFMAKNRIL